MITGATRLACVIGSPVRHSLSPALVNTACAHLGLDWVFLACEVAPGEARAALDALRVLGIVGMSVTMPHKHDVHRAVDELDPAAAALGAVNCVVPLPGGRLRGCNTDGDGFVDALRIDGGWDPQDRRVAVIGAGGAARAIVDALARAGASRVAVVNRSPANAALAAALAGDRGMVGTAADVAAADLVVNTTPLGMGSDTSLAVDPALLHPGQLVADIVYHPLRTPLIEAAAERGVRTLDGLGMLVHQAARAVELWSGRRPDASAMRAAALAELARRPQLAPPAPAERPRRSVD